MLAADTRSLLPFALEGLGRATHDIACAGSFASLAGVQCLQVLAFLWRYGLHVVRHFVGDHSWRLLPAVPASVCLALR
jgi:hypothetical protein